MSSSEFAKDPLQRDRFADTLTRLIAGVATARECPGGRVIAVDAPWGSGKSWIAERLANHLSQLADFGRCAYVNAFEFDYHSDPFAVLVSAACDSVAGETRAKRNLKAAAKKVLRIGAPAAAKAASSLALSALRIDAGDLAKSIGEALAEHSAKELDEALESLQKSKQTTEAFKARLRELASTSEGPVVIIIDELDRCRPTFALELLERVKHLFSVERVAFVLFVHMPAIYSVITMAYGNGINPVEYIRKFVSVTLSVPRTLIREDEARGERDFIDAFLRTQTDATAANRAFVEGIRDISPLFGPTHRQVQSVLFLAELSGKYAYSLGWAGAYALLLLVCEPDQHSALLRREKLAVEHEIERLRSKRIDRTFADELINGLYHSDSEGSGNERSGRLAELFFRSLGSLDLAFLRV